MTFGTEWGWGTDKDESRRVFDAYVDAGGNSIDTADFYTGGTSESWLGEFVRTRRDSLVLATKYVMCTTPGDPNAGGSHRKNLVQSLDASLKRLQTDRVDLLWVHAWDATVPIEETMRALRSRFTWILVTNNTKQAARVSDRTAFLLGGELVEEAPTAQLFTAPRDTRTGDYVEGRFG